MRNTNIFLGIIPLFLLINLSLNKQSDFQFPFQKKIWSYWHEEIQTAPFFIKVCYYKLKSQSLEAGFQFTVVNQNTVKNYIENYEQCFIKIRNNSYQYGPKFDADLIRLILIQQHGGVWVDLSTVFINGLSQLQNIMNPKYHHLITNKFSLQPDILLTYFTNNQNRIQQIIEIQNSDKKREQILYNQFPGYQAFFIAGRKDCQLIKAIRITYSNFTQVKYEELIKKFTKEDIYMHNQDVTNYLTLNMAISYVLQSKQKQLDKNLTLFEDRKRSFQYYKLWSFHAQLGPYFMKREFKLNQRDLFILSQQEIIEKGGSFYILFKLHTGNRVILSNQLEKLKQIFYSTKQSFESFLKSKPSIKQCQTVDFIVQNSLIQKILENSSLLQVSNIPTIKNEQYIQWKDYCEKLQVEVTGLIFYSVQQYINQLILAVQPFDGRSKINWVIHSQQDFNLKQFLVNSWKDNVFFIKIGAIVSIFLTIFIFVIKSFFRLLLNPYFEKLKNIYHLDDIYSLQNNITKNNNQTPFFQKFITCLKIKQISTTVILSNILIVNIIMYLFLDLFGGRNQPWTIFIVISLTYTTISFVESRIQESNSSNIKQTKNNIQLNECQNNNKATEINCLKVPSIQQNTINIQELTWQTYLYQQCYLIYNFLLVYMMLFQLMHSKIKITCLSVMAGIMWPILFEFIKHKKSQFYYKNSLIQKQDQHIINISVLAKSITQFKNLIDKNYCRLFVVFCFGLINLVPNIKHVPFMQTYLLTFILIQIITTATIILTGLVGLTLLQQKRWIDLLRLLLIVCAMVLFWKKDSYYDGIISLIGYTSVTLMFKTYIYMTCLYFQIGMEINTTEITNPCFKKQQWKNLKYLILPIVILLLDNVNFLPPFYNGSIGEMIKYQILTTAIICLIALMNCIQIYRKNCIDKINQSLKFTAEVSIQFHKSDQQQNMHLIKEINRKQQKQKYYH